MAIITKFNYLSSYLPKNSALEAVYNYLKKSLVQNTVENDRINNFSAGTVYKHEILDEIFTLEQVFFTKQRKDCFIESHKKYIDIQLVISGYEQMECINIEDTDIKRGYDEEKDLTIHNDSNKMDQIYLSTSSIAIFFPEDAHMGAKMFNDQCLVRKTVVKIPIKLWTEGKG